MNIPTKQECYALLEEYKVPKNVRDHIEQVTKIAVFVAKRLLEKGIAIDVDLVERAALLHDLLKPIDFRDFVNDPTGAHFTLNEIYFFSELQVKYHEFKHETAAFFLFDEKYPEMALVIRKHCYSDIINPKMQPYSWEEKVLTYSDKRVAHDKIVTLKERFIEGHSRYFTKNTDNTLTKEDTDKIDAAYLALEKEIFGIIGIDPDKIIELV